MLGQKVKSSYIQFLVFLIYSLLFFKEKKMEIMIEYEENKLTELTKLNMVRHNSEQKALIISDKGWSFYNYYQVSFDSSFYGFHLTSDPVEWKKVGIGRHDLFIKHDDKNIKLYVN